MKGWCGLVGCPIADSLPPMSGHPSAVGRTQDSESSPVKDRRFTTVPRNQCSVIRWCGPYCYFSVTWTDLVLPYLVSSFDSAEAVYVQRGLSWRDWDDRWLIKSHNCYLLTQPVCVCVCVVRCQFCDVLSHRRVRAVVDAVRTRSWWTASSVSVGVDISSTRGHRASLKWRRQKVYYHCWWSVTFLATVVSASDLALCRNVQLYNHVVCLLGLLMIECSIFIEYIERIRGAFCDDALYKLTFTLRLAHPAYQVARAIVMVKHLSFIRPSVRLSVAVVNLKRAQPTIEDCARRFVLLKLTTDRHEASRSLSATARLSCYRQQCNIIIII